MIEVAVGKRKILNPLRSNAKRPKVVKENMENASRVPEQIAGRRSDEGGESPFGIKPCLWQKLSTTIVTLVMMQPPPDS